MIHCQPPSHVTLDVLSIPVNVISADVAHLARRNASVNIPRKHLCTYVNKFIAKSIIQSNCFLTRCKLQVKFARDILLK